MSSQPLLGDAALPLNRILVAVDRDKNSTHAVRWVLHRLNNPLLVLVHVRLKPYQNPRTNNTDIAEVCVKQMFIPFRGFCARKGVQVKEVIIDDNDVTQALVDYISKNNIHIIVAGASKRNALSRKFRGPDVPTKIIRSAPEFCSVYVISKGKIQAARQAIRPLISTSAPLKQSVASEVPPEFSNGQNGVEHGNRGKTQREKKSRESNIFSPEGSIDPRRTLAYERFRNSIHLPNRGHNSMSDDNEFQRELNFASFDVTNQYFDFNMPGDYSPENSNSPLSHRGVEAELKRLKQELKQTMDMYNTACKEAISAKNQAEELNLWKKREERKLEEARLSEEAAHAVAEMEKVKCKAALAAAEDAQRFVEKEVQRRELAELKAKQETEEKNRALSLLVNNDQRYRRYSLEEIEAATGKFSESMKIGEGGYGPVFRGILDHTSVAIKVLRSDTSQGRRQFQQEVEVLCTMKHPNMVLLLGACPEYGCLVYEYLSNGSLEDRLLRKDNSPPLSWKTRFRIAAEIATALLFLHQAKPEPLVHRDLKPANILLDLNYVSKISDVGLARLVPPSVADSVTQYHMTAAAGTFCYIDPEYQQTGRLTTKSDIYSLGIMLLQIITAKPPMGLAHYVKKAIEKGRFTKALDPAVTDWPVEGAMAFAKLALNCLELKKKDRPDLSTVILPELNRLRNLGNMVMNDSSSNCSFGYQNNNQTRFTDFHKSFTLKEGYVNK